MLRIRKFMSLPATDRWLLVQILVFLPLTRIGLRFTGLKRTFFVLTWLATYSRQQPTSDETEEIERLKRWIRFTKLHGPYRGNCLSRSLLLHSLLLRKGIQCELRVGTRNSAGEFLAHAWLEYKGYPVNAGPRVHQKYSVFQRDLTPIDS